ncbi:hypothetical protein Lepto7376_3288 [[Leptolyngbya] sp. PCC 7376]|uniref:acyltransferase family protein n=1 Tax=[Leptolyngbya] sp. PCC 7376 TaxID=111781 RepID=UPI00029EE53F|nr:acyltransferase family protein [[Leptolyngbya] sp. PCC 7376]AFY39514.1 hypothetical protein Lepto7376_3288 [[Leptolyngbya] sp. PCC 7376]
MAQHDTRDRRIDLLRFIGITLIILAHVNPPEIIFQFRNFDVPLMILISGSSFCLSYKNQPFLFYFWKRVKRLVFSTWLFLSIYFLFLRFYYHSFPPITKVLESYVLDDGIGFVWIIRVFLMVGLCAPLIKKLFTNRISDRQYIVILFMVLMLNEGIRYFSLIYLPEAIAGLFNSTVLYLIPYAIVFAFGLLLPTSDIKKLCQIALLSLLTFCFMSSLLYIKYGEFVPTQAFKYPPSIYYLSYAMFVSILLWINSPRVLKVINRVTYLQSFILFVAQNSMWIYLWHILFMRVTPRYFFVVEFLIVYFSSVIITYMQVWILNAKILPLIKSSSLQKSIRIILTG